MASPMSRLRGHRAQVLLHVALLFIVAFGVSFAWSNQVSLGWLALGAIMAAGLSYRLVKLTDRSHKSFAQFIRNIAHNDFSTTTALQGDASTADLLEAQKLLIGKYKQLKADKSAQHEYLRMVIEHVDTALLCFDDAGKMVIANRAAKEILQTSSLITLSQVALISNALEQALQSLKPGKSQLLKIVIAGETAQLMLAAREFKLLGKDHKLVSMQNIQSAIDETEIASWQKLIKVLTHEIMNSMTPIVSLSSHLEKNLPDNENSDIELGIRSIASRSQGLLKFVESYRSLSNLPAAVPTELRFVEVLGHIERLTQSQVSANEATLTVDVAPSNLAVIADRNQIEQILLNLVGNAVDAISASAVRRVEVRAYLDSRQRPVVQISDSGCGIPGTQLSDIFTPFFTTKETGTGIGLSLSRQLARLNHASLDAQSEVGKGSAFSLVFERDRLLEL